MDRLEELIHRLERIEEALRLLTQQKVVQEFYSTGAVARILGKAEFTVREWCRLGRIRAEKRSLWERQLQGVDHPPRGTSKGSESWAVIARRRFSLPFSACWVEDARMFFASAR